MNYPADGVSITVNSQLLMVYRCGDVYRLLKNGDWRLIANTPSNRHGYNYFPCAGINYKRHRVIAYAFLNLDIDDLSRQVDHINGNKLCNNVDNLRIVSAQENTHNRTKAKGYSWRKDTNKWHAQIMVNRKNIHLGYYDTEEEARAAYIAGKLIHHPSAPTYAA